MNETERITERAVIVQAGCLDDVLELARQLADRNDQNDPLVSALRGAIAQVRCSAIMDP